MKDINISEAALKKMAKTVEEIGDYDALDYIGKYKGNDVFATGFEDKTNIPIIGYPTYFIVIGDSVRTVVYGEPEYDTLDNM